MPFLLYLCKLEQQQRDGGDSRCGCSCLLCVSDELIKEHRAASLCLLCLCVLISRDHCMWNAAALTVCFCLSQLGRVRVSWVPGPAVYPGERRLSLLPGLEWQQQLQNRAHALFQTYSMCCKFIPGGKQHYVKSFSSTSFIISAH